MSYPRDIAFDSSWTPYICPSVEKFGRTVPLPRLWDDEDGMTVCNDYSVSSTPGWAGSCPSPRKIGRTIPLPSPSVHGENELRTDVASVASWATVPEYLDLEAQTPSTPRCSSTPYRHRSTRSLPSNISAAQMFSPHEPSYSTPPSLIVSAPYIPSQHVIQLHAHLCRRSHDNHIAPLRWEISQAPSSAGYLTSHNTLLKPSLHEDAFPPMTALNDKLAIIPTVNLACGVSAVDAGAWMTRLWGPICTTNCNSDKIGAPVTVGDILTAIFDYFQTPISSFEFEHAVRLFRTDQSDSEEYKNAILYAAYSRMLLSQDGLEMERLKGLRRVDLLCECRSFNGLKVVFASDRTWAIHLDLTGYKMA